MSIQVAFENPPPEDEANLRTLALDLTDNRESVRITKCEDEPEWLVAELTMPAEPHDQAVERIDKALRVSLGNRIDTVIAFP